MKVNAVLFPFMTRRSKAQKALPANLRYACLYVCLSEQALSVLEDY